MESKFIVKRVCSICSKEAEGGIIINGESICNSCEKDIVKLNIESSTNYDFYIDKMNHIILS